MLKGTAADDDDSQHEPSLLDKLPNEVLQLIFDEFTCAWADKDDDGPASAALVLSHVCHLWKDALTPSHWSSIRIRNVKQARVLDSVLSRSMNHPLDIALQLRHVNASYFWPKAMDKVKTQWRLFDLFHTLSDHAPRLQRLTVEAKQAVLAWLEHVTLLRPLPSLTHLALIQSDKETCMQSFSPSCFDLGKCVSLTLVHTSIILNERLKWPALRKFCLSDIRAYELLRWIYDVEADEVGDAHYVRKSRVACFASIESLSISNTMFVRKRQQIVDFLSLFLNVWELELDCIDSRLILEILEADTTLMPYLQRVVIDGEEIHFGLAAEVYCVDEGMNMSYI
ncbi:hypothetical protein APHAL10511_008705 [Amanita phalloides]|nr:hypothetical protein APHAL10511_008705 [Amanita phalloides]